MPQHFNHAAREVEAPKRWSHKALDGVITRAAFIGGNVQSTIPMTRVKLRRPVLAASLTLKSRARKRSWKGKSSTSSRPHFTFLKSALQFYVFLISQAS